MSTKSITGTGLLLAVALLAQSLRLIFPFIPNQVSMFLIGSITSALPNNQLKYNQAHIKSTAPHALK